MKKLKDWQYAALVILFAHWWSTNYGDKAIRDEIGERFRNAPY